MLRPSLEGHFARIRRIDTAAQGRWLVSDSDGKTVKVWRLAGALQPQEGGLYKAVETRLLTHEAVTREAIREGLNWDGPCGADRRLCQRV